VRNSGDVLVTVRIIAYFVPFGRVFRLILANQFSYGGEDAFAAVLTDLGADTRQDPGRNGGCDIDFAVFHFRP